MGDRIAFSHTPRTAVGVGQVDFKPERGGRGNPAEEDRVCVREGDERAMHRAPKLETYRGTILERKRTPLASYCRPVPRVLGGS